MLEGGSVAEREVSSSLSLPAKTGREGETILQTAKGSQGLHVG